jgi:hypothetical protein
MWAMNSRALAVAAIACLAGPGFLAAAGTTNFGPSPGQSAAVEDNVAWVKGVIDGLAQMADPLQPLTQSKPKRYSLAPAAAAMPMNLAPVFVGRHFKLKKATAFGIFDVQVDETSPKSFTLMIASAEAAENVEVKDARSKAVYVDKPLDDEKAFSFQVAAPLSADIGIAVSIVQDDSINKAFFPLLDSGEEN